MFRKVAAVFSEGICRTCANRVRTTATATTGLCNIAITACARSSQAKPMEVRQVSDATNSMVQGQ